MRYFRFKAIGFLLDLVKGLPTFIFNPRRYLCEIRHLLMLTRNADVAKHPMLKRQMFPVIPRYGFGIAAHFADYCRVSDFFCQPELPVLREVEAINMLVRFKMFRSYQCSGLSVTERTDRLIAHYRTSMTLFGPTLFRDAHLTGCELCRIELPGGNGKLSVHLENQMRTWLEGELSLVLRDDIGRWLYLLTFSLSAEGDRRMFIGSIIGVAPRERIKRLTKEMYGLRPQALALFTAQALCRYFSIHSLQAVSTRGQVWTEIGRPERVRFNYDAFWQEHGGFQCDDPRVFHLPVAAMRRNEDEIANRKRAQYRRRYALMDEMEKNLVFQLDIMRANSNLISNSDRSGYRLVCAHRLRAAS